jgi:hypothetical protein
MIAEKLRAMGFHCTGVEDGLPIFPGVFLREIDGLLKAFKDREYKPWEQPETAPAWSAEDLAKVKAVIDGDYARLSDDDRSRVNRVHRAERDERRRRAYVSDSDHLFFEWQAAEAEDGKPHEDLKRAWLKARGAVKSRFPDS